MTLSKISITSEKLKNRSKFAVRYLSIFGQDYPDFLIIGAQKGGTSSLYSYLLQHPNILPSLTKEVHFFDRPSNRKKGHRWYKSHFPTRWEKQRKQAITGEATPLMQYFHAPRLISEAMPTVKIIMLLRNPVDRALSHYKHNTRRPGREPLSFSDAIRQEPERIAADLQQVPVDEWHHDRSLRRYGYAHRGFYAQQLERWLNYFPKEQVLVAKSEDFYANPQTCLDQVTDFLGLPRHAFELGQKFNVGGYSDTMANADRHWLEQVFEPENKQLFQLLGEHLW